QLRHDHEGDRRDGSAPSTRRRFSGVSIGQSVAVGEALPRRIAGNWITEPRQLTDNVHSTRSSHREALLEHLFAGEVMKHLWRRGDWRLPDAGEGCPGVRRRPAGRVAIGPGDSPRTAGQPRTDTRLGADASRPESRAQRWLAEPRACAQTAGGLGP